MTKLKADPAAISFHRARYREMLRKGKADEFLAMIWYADALTSDRAQAIRGRFEYPGGASDYTKLGSLRVHKWELEELVNEFFTISGSLEVRYRRLNYTSWEPVRRLINLQRKVSNAESMMDVEDILDAMPRLFWPQASWQIGYVNATRTYRNLYVYGSPEASTHFESEFGLSIERFFFLSSAIFAHSAASGPCVDLVGASVGLGVPVEHMRRFLSVVSQSTAEMSKRARELRSGNGISAFNRLLKNSALDAVCGT